MKDLRIEDEIIASWKGDIDKPVVSICCITYNHEPYIEDALKGFLIQETDFPFEILIHDDASTDNTAEIIRKYEAIYPKIIKVVYQKINQYSRGNKPLPILRDLCNGEYIAFCEGDDYWVDNLKLQKQIDYLNENPSVVISVHDTQVYDQEKKTLYPVDFSSKYRRNWSQEELQKKIAFLRPLSWVYRNISFPHIAELNKVVNGDAFFTSIIGEYGSCYFHSDIKPGVYRVHSGGIWSGASVKRRLQDQANTRFFMYRYYERIDNEELKIHFYRQYLTFLTKSLFVSDLVIVLKIAVLDSQRYKNTIKALLGERLQAFFRR